MCVCVCAHITYWHTYPISKRNNDDGKVVIVVITAITTIIFTNYQ